MPDVDMNRSSRSGSMALAKSMEEMDLGSEVLIPTGAMPSHDWLGARPFSILDSGHRDPLSTTWNLDPDRPGDHPWGSHDVDDNMFGFSLDPHHRPRDVAEGGDLTGGFPSLMEPAYRDPPELGRSRAGSIDEPWLKDPTSILPAGLRTYGFGGDDMFLGFATSGLPNLPEGTPPKVKDWDVPVPAMPPGSALGASMGASSAPPRRPSNEPRPVPAAAPAPSTANRRASTGKEPAPGKSGRAQAAAGNSSEAPQHPRPSPSDKGAKAKRPKPKAKPKAKKAKKAASPAKPSPKARPHTPTNAPSTNPASTSSPIVLAPDKPTSVSSNGPPQAKPATFYAKPPQTARSMTSAPKPPAVAPKPAGSTSTSPAKPTHSHPVVRASPTSSWTPRGMGSKPYQPANSPSLSQAPSKPGLAPNYPTAPAGAKPSLGAIRAGGGPGPAAAMPRGPSSGSPRPPSAGSPLTTSSMNPNTSTGQPRGTPYTTVNRYPGGAVISGRPGGTWTGARIAAAPGTISMLSSTTGPRGVRGPSFTNTSYVGRTGVAGRNGPARSPATNAYMYLPSSQGLTARGPPGQGIGVGTSTFQRAMSEGKGTAALTSGPGTPTASSPMVAVSTPGSSASLAPGISISTVPPGVRQTNTRPLTIPKDVNALRNISSFRMQNAPPPSPVSMQRGPRPPSFSSSLAHQTGMPSTSSLGTSAPMARSTFSGTVARAVSAPHTTPPSPLRNDLTGTSRPPSTQVATPTSHSTWHPRPPSPAPPSIPTSQAASTQPM